MEQKENVLILCDTEEEYAQLFGEYMRKQKELPWQIHIYTDIEELLQKEQQGNAVMLVAAENAYCEEMNFLQPERTVILNESGIIRWDEVRNINKYQQAAAVFRELLEVYMDIAAIQLPILGNCCEVKFIGMYSPVRRCLQTSFAITMSQMLAGKHSTLYLNFEHYAGLRGLLPGTQGRDLADLLYFLTAEGDKFRLRIQTMIEHMGNLDYIPPMMVGQNLLTITGVEWINLLQRISELGKYEYVILDLSESMQGLFDILRMCTKVFTLTTEDRVAQCKMMQYEHVLAMNEYEDVLEKTHKCFMPKLRQLPVELDQYTRGELAEYVKKQIEELEKEENEEQK